MTWDPIAPALSALQAIQILQAWNEKDAARLESALATTQSTLPKPSGLKAEEAERRELLSGIAEQMRRLLGQAARDTTSPDRMEVCLALLRHLSASHC